MRQGYLHFCEQHPAHPELAASSEYQMETRDQDPVSASDADVGVIAAHAARIAVDCLLPNSDQGFPHSFYLIGLAKAWVFSEPFVAIPLEMPALSRSVVGTLSADESEKVAGFLADLLARSDLE
jgi:hypothetical protein